MDNYQVLCIADPHFYHANIIKYENRPFKDVNEMNNVLIKNWNSVVSKYSKVFVLGDFMVGHKDDLSRIISQLNGYKILIMGNHDTLSTKTYLKAGFDEVSKYPVIYNKFIIMSHEPLYMNDNMPYVNIFGHVHGNSGYCDFSKVSACVSVERIGYTPIKLSDILRSIEKEGRAL